MKFISSFLFLSVFIFAKTLAADSTDSPPILPPPPPPPSITHHTTTIDGKLLSYQAIAGSLQLHNDEAKPIADVFYVAYRQDKGPSNRPITFCFDGGPGNASVWLHLGGIGPKQIDLSSPTQKYSDNPYTLLDLTDLVFVDPISTGFSKPIPANETKNSYSSKEDTKLLANFIRVYLTQNGLWGSPKYILGQGFGGFRACDIAYFLYDENFIFLDGLVLLSSILNYQTISDPDEGNDLPYALAVPSYTLAHNFHSNEALPNLKNIEAFIQDTYTKALFQGNNLPADSAQKVAQDISGFTGINQDYILRGNLKVDALNFSKTLLRTKQKYLSLYDTRLTTLAENEHYDPTCPQLSDEPLTGKLAAAINTYLSQVLRYSSPNEYVIQANVCPWTFSHNKNQFPTVMDKLKYVLNKNTQQKLFSAAGYYDLIAPYYAIQYNLSHLSLEPTVQSRVTAKNYPSGHFITLDPTAQKQLKSDLTQFYLQGQK